MTQATGLAQGHGMACQCIAVRRQPLTLISFDCRSSGRRRSEAGARIPRVGGRCRTVARAWGKLRCYTYWLMRRVALLLITLTIAASGQTMPTRIPPEEAAKHLINKPWPNYPQLAEAGRITGNVILQISIDDSGTASVQRAISGHPLLVPAAIDAANHWKYQPFEVDGKPAAVVTVVMVTFGNAWTHEAEDRAEMLFQRDFWTAEEAAQAAIAKGDYARSEEQLNKARELVSTHSVGLRNVPERWQWLTTMGHLRMLQQKYDEAEEYYRKALALQNRDKDAPELAASLANLGKLFAEENDSILRTITSSAPLPFTRKILRRSDPATPVRNGFTGEQSHTRRGCFRSSRHSAMTPLVQTNSVTPFWSFRVSSAQLIVSRLYPPANKRSRALLLSSCR